MIASEPLPHLVDDLLGYLHETHPTDASLDGVHGHDDLLEVFAPQAIEAEARALAGYLRRLDEVSRGSLTNTERLEQRMLIGCLRARTLELEEVRTWERTPQIYADVLATSLIAQSLSGHAPVSERARRVLSKLRQTPRLVQSARDNVKEPPGIFVKVGLESLKGVRRFVDDQLPRVFSAVDDMHLLGDLADAQMEASAALGAYIQELETEVAPRARASFRIGRDKLEQKLKWEEGLAIPLDRLLSIASRELQETQTAFREAAAKIDAGDPADVWAKARLQHPGPGAVVAAAREQVDELAAFLDRQTLVTRTAGEPLAVARTPDFYRWTGPTLWAQGALEAKPAGAVYYVAEADPSWPASRQEEHLREHSVPTLWARSIREVYPGRLLHLQARRRLQTKARKSAMFASASLVDGWAHYAEQAMVEAGFGRRDHALKLSQLAEVLVQLARVIVYIRLHAEDLSVEQGVRFFRDEAFMEEASARREAERGTFATSYFAAGVGRLMLLKLRADYKRQQGKSFALRTFHDTLLAQGAAPFWVHRTLLLGEENGDLIE